MSRNNPNRQGFMNTVDSIRHMEADKDTFLKASRLERHESRGQPLTAAQKMKIATVGGVGIVLIAILAFGYLAKHFIPALLCVGVIAFIGMMVLFAGD